MKGGQKGADGGEGEAGKEAGREGRMSDRVASCGSLYDSTSLLLQYCNNGELLHDSPQTHTHTHNRNTTEFVFSQPK